MTKKGIAIIIGIIASPFIIQSQTITQFLEGCNTVKVESKVDLHHTDLKKENYKDPYEIYYRFDCKQIKTLYGLPIQKIIVTTNKQDTVESISVYLPFDTTLSEKLRLELGIFEYGWMARLPETDSEKTLATKVWYFKKATIGLCYTRYKYLLGDIKEDLTVISILPRRRSSQL
jgi:hypothetical protein